MEKQVKYLYYGLTRNSNKPLDPRFKIQSLSTIDSELKEQYRYSGLIFFVIDENKHYLFLNDITTPITLSSFLSSNEVKGLSVLNYSNLTNDLNDTEPTIGKIVTVYPLGVSFIFGGVNWSYYNGVYNIQNDAQLNTLPNSLRKEGALIIYPTNVRYVFNNDLTKSTEVIVSSGIPGLLERNRYYNINGILYYSINDTLYRIGEKIFIIENVFLNVGETPINHNFNSNYISVLFRINLNNQLITLNTVETLPFKIVNTNQIMIKSDFVLNGDLIITAK